MHLVYIGFMKLIIQIPCYNEEETLLTTLKEIPTQYENIDCVEILIIDDGCIDKTVEIAKEFGVQHIVSHPRNLGLARAFSTGIKKAVELGADIVVNLDADNQYRASDIKELLVPILDKSADIVIGNRPIETIKSFSPTKKLLQKLGSFVVRKISGADIKDAPSGFRAFNRDAAIKINIFDNYTYTMETIIQAQSKGLIIKSVPIGVNEDLRPSKLVKNNFDYIKRSCFTILRFLIIYRPFRFFMKLSLILFVLGLALGGRFLYFYLTGSGQGHVQSLILCAILLLMGFQAMFFAVVADLLAINRRLLEDVQYNLKKG